MYVWDYIWEMEIWVKFCFQLQWRLFKIYNVKDNKIIFMDFCLCFIADIDKWKRDGKTTWNVQEKWKLQTEDTQL